LPSKAECVLEELLRFETLDAWSEWLSAFGWVGGFDLPFGLPRELVQMLNWPTDWSACMQHFAALSQRGDSCAIQSVL
jgi:hypothetical protein